MDPELKAQWVKALRSGEYRQGRELLKSSAGAFCCLGVLCDIQGAVFDNPLLFSMGMQTSHVPPVYSGGLGLNDQTYLAEKNDNGQSFIEIADYIEANH